MKNYTLYEIHTHLTETFSAITLVSLKSLSCSDDTAPIYCIWTVEIKVLRCTDKPTAQLQINNITANTGNAVVIAAVVVAVVIALVIVVVNIIITTTTII
jgi:hypothetical protein